MVRHAGTADFVPARRGEAVYLQDTVATDTSEESKIWWKGSSSVQADASLGSYSSLSFLGFERDRRATHFAGQVGQGVVRFVKRLPRSNPPSSFAIFTPSALVAVIPTDRAADYVVEVFEDLHTQVTVIWGEVIVKNVSDAIPEQRHLRSCQTVTVAQNQPPSAVMGVSTETLEELIGGNDYSEHSA